MTGIDVNEPIVSEHEPFFCETDNALARAFLREAASAVRMAAAKDPRDLQASVTKSLLVFLRHHENCALCRGDQIL